MSEEQTLVGALGRLVAGADRVIARTLELACVVLVAGLLLVVSGAVLLRLFDIAPSGSDALIRLMFAWLSLIGATLILREGGHLAISVLSDRLRGRYFHANLLIVELLVLAFLLVLINTGWNYAMSSNRSLPGLPISTRWGHTALPVTATVMCLYVLARIVTRIPKLVRGTEADSETVIDDGGAIPPS